MQPCRHVFQCEWRWLWKMINMSSLRVSNYCQCRQVSVAPAATFGLYRSSFLWRSIKLDCFTVIRLKSLTLHVVELTSVNGMLATHYTTLDIPVWVVLLWTCPVWTCKCNQFLLAVVNYYWCADIYRGYVRTYTITHLLLSLLPCVYLSLQLLNRKALFTTHLLWPS